MDAPYLFDPATPRAPVPAASSAEPGFLAPSPGSAVLTEDQLDAFFQWYVAGLTGLSPDLVRVRWQEEPANAPPVDTDWIAVGVTDWQPLGYPAAAEVDDPAGEGSRRSSDHVELRVTCSCYGPHGASIARRLREAAFLCQSWEPLQLCDLAFVDAEGPTRVPTPFQTRYRQRYDLTLVVRRMAVATYPVRYFLTAPVQVVTDAGVTSDRG